MFYLVTFVYIIAYLDEELECVDLVDLALCSDTKDY